jgi:hypothetical protein
MSVPIDLVILNLGIKFVRFLLKLITMATTKKSSSTAKKRGPKDRSYVNKSESHEVDYAPKRKSPAKKFGSK